MNCLLFGNYNKSLEDQIIKIHTECGFPVLHVLSFDEGYAIIKKKQPLGIIFSGVDDEMLAFVKRLRTEFKVDSLILAVFEHPPAYELDELVASGIDDIILPPLNTYRLESRIRFAVQRAMQRAERRQIETALRKSEANAHAIVNTSVDGIITIDEDARILTYNRAAEEIFGYTAEEVIGRNVNMLMPSPFREEHDAYVKSYHETNHKKIIGIGREVRGLRKNGETFPLELAVSEIKSDNQRTYTGIVRDISIRRELESELLRTAEDERRRIGQDIHDGLGQMLTGIGLIAMNLSHSMRAKNHENAEAVAELVDLIKNADQQARTIARTLIPVELEQGGLKAAIMRLGENISKLYRLQCSYEETGTIPSMNATVTTHFFRIIQEAMGNAAKHSKARHVTVTLAGSSDKIRARIRDNGVGVDPSKTNGKGMGLRTMQHRANVIGATLDIRAASPSGTMVTCTLPITTTMLSHPETQPQV